MAVLARTSVLPRLTSWGRHIERGRAAPTGAPTHVGTDRLTPLTRRIRAGQPRRTHPTACRARAPSAPHWRSRRALARNGPAPKTAPVRHAALPGAVQASRRSREAPSARRRATALGAADVRPAAWTIAPDSARGGRVGRPEHDGCPAHVTPWAPGVAEAPGGPRPAGVWRARRGASSPAARRRRSRWPASGGGSASASLAWSSAYQDPP
jgi:hypothetical protein